MVSFACKSSRGEGTWEGSSKCSELLVPLPAKLGSMARIRSKPSISVDASSQFDGGPAPLMSKPRETRVRSYVKSCSTRFPNVKANWCAFI